MITNIPYKSELKTNYKCQFARVLRTMPGTEIVDSLHMRKQLSIQATHTGYKMEYLCDLILQYKEHILQVTGKYPI